MKKKFIGITASGRDSSGKGTALAIAGQTVCDTECETCLTV